MQINPRGANMLLAGWEPFQSDCQQIVLLHNPRYPLVVHAHSLRS